MKKIIMLILVATYCFAGSYVNIPASMYHDTSSVATTRVKYFHFNEMNKANEPKFFEGFLDYLFFADDSTESTDSVLVKIIPFYYLHRKSISGDPVFGSLGWQVMEISDTTSLGYFQADSLLHSVPLDSIMTQMPIMDGVKVLYTPSGGNLDIWQGFRSLWKEK